MPSTFAIQSIAVPLTQPDYFTRSFDGQPAVTSSQLLDRIASLGANDVRIIDYYGQLDTPDGSTYSPFNPQSIQSLKVFADDAHARGIAITLDPLTLFKTVPAGQVAHVDPSDPAAWFANYRTVVLEQAGIAQAIGAERYTVLTDIEQLAFIKNPSLTAPMVQLIADVRAIYSGQITSVLYSGDGNLPAFPTAILKAMDLVGVGLFPVLTTKTDPTLEELQAALHRDVKGADVLGNLARLAQTIGKPLWLSDVAQSSYDGWLRGSPDKYDPTAHYVPDNSEQVLGYQAYFNELSKLDPSWFKGISIQSITRVDDYGGLVPPYFSGPAAETFWGKPGEVVIRDYYGGNVALAATTGNDTLNGGAANETINGKSGDDLILGGEGTNYLRGDEGNDSIQGGSGFDDANGNMGNDTIHGGAGDDYSVGGKDNDLLFGDDGNDIVWGNLGDDSCDGGAGNDQVRGGQGNDSVAGGAGNDFVSGDRGNDTITGGAGADLFHDSQDAGIDRVLDFNVAEGDRVQLDPGTTYTISQVGADTVLDMGGGNQMILVGVSMSTLAATSIFLG